MKPLELYLHIPFCIKKCNYCDFLSAPSTARERRKYVESLCRKICTFADMAKAYRVVTIFVGGGTPSILEEEQIKMIFAAVRDTFPVEENAEITMEINPGTVTAEKFRAYRKAGINRLSIGLQSVDDQELKALGRIHTFEQFLETFHTARKEGFYNINIDLMSAIPHQTSDSWERTLRTVAELSPEHISAYSLIIEEGTPFYDWYRTGENAEKRCRTELPDEEAEREIYYNTKKILQGYGYNRYEISNYAKPGYECRHNLGYWERTEYLGIGRGAASLIENKRWNDGEEPQKLSVSEQMEEYMFLGLRKMQGVSEYQFLEIFQCDMRQIYGSVIEDMEKKGLLEIKHGFVRLTEKGIDVSNYVMSEFLLTSETQFR